MTATALITAALGGYAVIRIVYGRLNRMTRNVPNPVRCAVSLLLLPGVAGKALAPFWPEAQVHAQVLDLMLVGGLALYMGVDRRAGDDPPSWRLVARTAGIVVLIFGGLFAAAIH